MWGEGKYQHSNDGKSRHEHIYIYCACKSVCHVYAYAYPLCIQTHVCGYRIVYVCVCESETDTRHFPWSFSTQVGPLPLLKGNQPIDTQFVPWIPCIHLLSPGIIEGLPRSSSFWSRYWGYNSSPDTCMASSLSTGPSLQLQESYTFTFLFYLKDFILSWRSSPSDKNTL